MARPSKGKTLESLEGRLGSIRQEVHRILRDLKREIGKRETDLSALKTRYQRGLGLLQGKVKASAAPARPRAKRAPQIDWNRVFAALPARFTLDALIRHPKAGKRPKPHLYAIVSRWKKEKKSSWLASAPPGCTPTTAIWRRTPLASYSISTASGSITLETPPIGPQSSRGLSGCNPIYSCRASTGGTET